MNSKTVLLLVLVAIAGIALGAVGMHYVGSWEGIAQTLAALRQPASSSLATRRATAARTSAARGRRSAPRP